MSRGERRGERGEGRGEGRGEIPHIKNPCDPAWKASRQCS